jgi:hypothetical protein
MVLNVEEEKGAKFLHDPPPPPAEDDSQEDDTGNDQQQTSFSRRSDPEINRLKLEIDGLKTHENQLLVEQQKKIQEGTALQQALQQAIAALEQENTAEKAQLASVRKKQPIFSYPRV